MTTFTDRREATWRWLGIAPPIVVLSICLSAVGALASWTWLIAGEVREHQTVAAVSAQRADAAQATAAAAQSTSAATAAAVDARLNRIEDKLDHLLEVVANRPRQEKIR